MRGRSGKGDGSGAFPLTDPRMGVEGRDSERPRLAASGSPPLGGPRVMKAVTNGHVKTIKSTVAVCDGILQSYCICGGQPECICNEPVVAIRLHVELDRLLAIAAKARKTESRWIHEMSLARELGETPTDAQRKALGDAGTSAFQAEKAVRLERERLRKEGHEL